MSDDDYEAVADLLDDAAGYIETHGWTQRVYADPNGRVCALGAIGIVGRVVGPVVVTHAVLALRDTIGHSVAFWNDHPDRTEQQVRDTLRAAAKGLRA
jgi:hypothetical protein